MSRTLPRKSRIFGRETRQPLYIIWNEPFASIFGDTIAFVEDEEDEEEARLERLELPTRCLEGSWAVVLIGWR